MKILIVDDEDHIRAMMRLTLEAAGHSVAEASDGPAGLQAFGDGQGWDVVLLDQKMPGVEGTEVLREMRRRKPGAVVILVTAFASIDLVIEAMHLGATDFLRKPMTPDALRGAVAAAAGRPAPPRTIPSAPARPIETLTMNGFHIRHTGTDRDASGAVRHQFTVTRYPQQQEQAVNVTIDPEAVARVERLTKRELPADAGFWRQQAERLLAAYLWSEGAIPLADQLRVAHVSRADMDL
ncbi:MAG TPA: response regulator, partial [Vicinamibacterales bacterium]|nr:response regulator [Vicinamibacterales bacterium]